MRVEACAASRNGKVLKTQFTALENLGFAYVTGYANIRIIIEALTNPITEDVMDELKLIAAEAPESAVAAPGVAQPQLVQHSDPRAMALLNTAVEGVMVSVSSGFWNWDGEPPQDRYSGQILRWTDKAKLLPCILWEGATRGKTELLEGEGSNPDCNYLLQKGLEFRLEPYGDGRPPPEAPEASLVAEVSLLSSSDLSNLDVLVARYKAVVAPAWSYFKDRVLVKRAQQVKRMEKAQIFNPLHAQVHHVTGSDIDALPCFKFSNRPDYAEAITKMKGELTKYNALVSQIKPKEERMVAVRGGKGKMVDSWNIQTWWRHNKGDVPSFFKVLRAVLTHSPNSCIPEAIFSVLADSFDDEQKSAHSDYMELSLQLQYSKRAMAIIELENKLRSIVDSV